MGNDSLKKNFGKWFSLRSKEFLHIQKLVLPANRECSHGLTVIMKNWLNQKLVQLKKRRKIGSIKAHQTLKLFL